MDRSDYNSRPFRGSRVLYVGGNSNTNGSNSVNYGLSYMNANNDLSNSNNNIGSRLNFAQHNTVIPTLPKCRTQESIQVGLVAQAKDRQINKGIMRKRLSGCYERLCDIELLERAS